MFAVLKGAQEWDFWPIFLHYAILCFLRMLSAHLKITYPTCWACAKNLPTHAEPALKICLHMLSMQQQIVCACWACANICLVHAQHALTVKQAAVMQASAVMTATSNSKEDSKSMTAHNKRNASNSRNESNSRTANTVGTPTTAGMLQKRREAAQDPTDHWIRPIKKGLPAPECSRLAAWGEVWVQVSRGRKEERHACYMIRTCSTGGWTTRKRT